MKFNAFALTVIAAVASVHAQSTTSGSAAAPSSTVGLSPCILQCTTQAATAAGCNGVTDLTCVCTNTTFQQQARTCLQQSCTAAEVQAAEALQSQECGTISSSAASSGATSAPASSSGTRSGAASSSGAASHASSGASSLSTATSARTSSAGTAAASQSGNAARADLSVARGGVAGLAAAVVGVVAGAAFVM